MAIAKHTDDLKLPFTNSAKDSLNLVTTEYHFYTIKQSSNLHRIKLSRSDSLKGFLYTALAVKYSDYDTISDRKKRSFYQGQALKYTMMALHQYSGFNDSVGLRICFDNLAKVYSSQKKYTQAKWFILQSNALSRGLNDVPNIIASLITLSTIKSSIKDYKLAMGDLNEALQLSQKNKLPKKEAEVLKNYAMLYSRMQDYPKEAAMLKKRDSVEESIRKKEEAVMVAKIAAQDSVEKKKTDSLQVKKKVVISVTKKSSKNGSAKKIASL